MRIRKKTIDMQGLRLSPVEGFVLSRVDGNTTVEELVALTGLDEARLFDIVGRLRAEGLVELEAGASAPVEAGPQGWAEPDTIRDLASFDEIENEPRLEPVDELEEVHETAPGEEVHETADELEEVHETAPGEESAPPLEDDPERAAPTEAAEPASESTEAEDGEAAEAEARTEGQYRKLYETKYHPLTRDERAAAALVVTGADLLALCFDPDPQVIHSLLSNARIGPDAARLIAAHHHTHAGLEILTRRSEFAGDALVQRRLLRNPQLPATILHRMLGPKPLLDVYKIAVDREISERSRLLVREVLRKKFMLAPPDERAALLIKTEGRCLILLVNCNLDAHTTKILTNKSHFSVLFIQNLARWPATPPQLLAHLLKQQVVLRNAGLRKMLLKHRNTPSELKRTL